MWSLCTYLVDACKMQITFFQDRYKLLSTLELQAMLLVERVIRNLMSHSSDVIETTLILFSTIK